MRSIKGHPKLNKISLGDRVTLSKSIVEWSVKNCPDHYTIPGSREFEKDTWPELLFWFTHAVGKTQPTGKVICFGSEEDSSPRRNVGVEFKSGRRKFFAFYSEDNLTKVNKV